MMYKVKLLFIFICVAGLSTLGYGQMYNEITSTVYLQNGKVITKPGAAPIRTNILIKDGMIREIGNNITIPYDAKIIAIDSHFVYAGFIDALNHTGLKRDEPTANPERGQGRAAQQGPRIVPGQATLEQSGVTPQKSVVKSYSPEENSVKDMRNQGVTVAHVVPTGLMLPGKGSIISLKKGGTTDQHILKKDMSTYARLAPTGSLSPSTIIGVMSKFRDVYKNAEILQKNSMAFDMGKEGVSRPSYSEEYNAMIPVVNKKEQVFFETSQVKDIHKAMILQKELGFPIVLSSITMADGLINEIKKLNSPLILSLKLPEPIKKDTADKKKKTEEDMLIAKRSEDAYNVLVGQAAMLEKNGVKFAISMKDVKPADIKKSIKTLVDKGLSESQALAALTTNAADLFGMSSKMGSVEVGKMANLVICDTSYFAEKSKIKFVLVEGQVYEQKPAEKPARADNKPVSAEKGVLGKFSYSVNVMDNINTGWVKIEKKADSYKIFVKSDDSNDIDEDVNKIDIKDLKVKFELNTDIGGSPIIVNFDLTFDGDNYSGTANIGGFGSFPISGKRIPE